MIKYIVSIDKLKPAYINTFVKTDTTLSTSNSSTDTSLPSTPPTHKSTLRIPSKISGSESVQVMGL